MIRKEEKNRKKGQNTYNVQKYHFLLLKKDGYHSSTTSEVDRHLETKIKKWVETISKLCDFHI
jgi:hypothetical protein